MSERTSIGEKRLEYLDTANKCRAAGDYGATLRNVNNFLSTIREHTDVSKKIQARFDELERKKNDTLLKIVQDTEKMELFQQIDDRAKGLEWVTAQNISDQLDACWSIAMEEGAFND